MSSNKVQCNKCKKFFSQTRLKLHQEKCLEKEEFKCEYCDQFFCSKQSLLRHYTVCKQMELKKEIQAIQTINNLQEEEINELRKEIISLKKLHQKEISDQRLEYEFKINHLVEKHLCFQDHAKEKEKMFRDQIRVLESRPATVINNSQVNNNCNTQINQLLSNVKPISCTELTNEINLLVNGEDFLPDDEYALASKLFYRCLKNQLVKSDSSRKVVLWKDEDDKTIKDPKAIALSSKILSSSRQIFFDKKLVLENDRNSPTLNPEFKTIIDKWISLCNRIVDNSEFSKRAFGKKLAELTYDKATFASSQQAEALPDPHIAFFSNQLYHSTSFFFFISGVRGFGHALKTKFEDHWCLPSSDEDIMEFRLSKQDDYKPLSLDKLKECIITCLDQPGFEQFVNKCFAIYDKEIISQYRDDIDDSATMTREACLEILNDTLTSLRDPDDSCWNTIYNILLCIE